MTPLISEFMIFHFEFIKNMSKTGELPTQYCTFKHGTTSEFE